MMVVAVIVLSVTEAAPSGNIEVPPVIGTAILRAASTWIHFFAR